MVYELSKIDDIVQKYALIISKVTNVDVEVVDRNLFRVAGTGVYEKDIKKDMSSKGYVYKHVLKTGERQIIGNPGENRLCKDCPDKYNCVEKFEISMPIMIEEETVGIIGMVTTHNKVKELIENNLNNYLDLLEQVSDFISIKLFESYQEERKASLINMLDTITEHMNQGAMILNRENEIVSINKSGKEQLKSNKNLIGEKVEIEDTGDSLNSKEEFLIFIKGKKYTVIGEKKDIHNNVDLSMLLLFTDIHTIQSDIYAMTATFNKEKIIGSSNKIHSLLKDIKKIASSSSTVLITGESGTGKEMVATTIWKNGNRKDQRFVAINCAAIPESLLESELFGYSKGAFTGADPNGRIGKFELANKGVLFLDEIGDMPLYLQTKLLRVLEDKSITRIGSNHSISLDVRIIAATNKDLKIMIQENRFREDLFYRLNVIPIEIPPLRERKEDILELVNYFIERYTKLFGKEYRYIEKSTLDKLYHHTWVGNVRELENAVEFMVNMMEDGILNDETLPKNILYSKIKEKETEDKKLYTLEHLEKKAIKRAIELYGTSAESKKVIAKELGIGIATLYRKINKYGLH